MSSKADPGRWAFLFFALIALAPIGFSLYYAAAYSLGLAGMLSEGFTLSHWAKVAGGGEILASMAYSGYIALAATVASVGLALFLALALRRAIARGPLSLALYLPLTIPAVVAGFLAFQWLSDAGLLARLAAALGLIDGVGDMPPLIHDRLGLGVIAAHTALATPFFTLLFAQLHRTERIEALTDLTRTLGGGRRDCLFRVAAPILLTKAFSNILLLFIFVFGSYEIPLLLGRQSPQMVSVFALRKFTMFDLTQKPEAYIVALLYTAATLGLLAMAFRLGWIRDEA